MTARLAEQQKEALAKKAEEAQMKLLEEERTREERRQVWNSHCATVSIASWQIEAATQGWVWVH